jgi:hypothetical protein
MSFESVRAYVQLASGLGDLTRARAIEAAQGLLTLPAVGIATGTKVASQASVLADELLAAGAANRANLQSLVRGEVDAAITRLGLVPVQRLERAEAEAAELRKEVARLRSTSSNAASAKSAAKKAAPRTRAKQTSAPSGAAKKATAKKATAKKAGAGHRSSVTTRAKPAGA